MLYSSICTFSMVFVRKSVTRLPLVPLQGSRNDATGFTLCYGLLFCTCFSQAYLASTQSVTQKHWRLATRLTGDYLDQTFTGKLITACRTQDLHPLERAHSVQMKRAPGGALMKRRENSLQALPLFSILIFKHSLFHNHQRSEQATGYHKHCNPES